MDNLRDNLCQNHEFEEQICSKFVALEEQFRSVVVGLPTLFETITIALASEANTIAIGPPGGGKSLTVQTVAAAVGLPHKVIQGTPDLLPKDILGFARHKEDGTSEYVSGPITESNIVVLDEMNRLHPKTMSAFLGAMQDKAVSIVDIKEPVSLPRPFFVMGTKNPKETEQGTYYEGAAMLNRFGLSCPTEALTDAEYEDAIGRNTEDNLSKVKVVLTKDDLLETIAYVRLQSNISEHPVKNYIARLASEFRELLKQKNVEDANEISVRAGVSLWVLLNSYRVVSGAKTIGPESVEHLIHRVWQHRLNMQDDVEAKHLIDELLLTTAYIPRPS